jgi:plastocyanin domain-containing protein
LDLKFPISVKEDLKKFKIAETSKLQNAADSVLSMIGVQDNLNVKKEGALNPLLVIEVNDLSGALTSVVFNPNRDIVEDRIRPIKFNTKFFSMIVAKV